MMRMHKNGALQSWLEISWVHQHLELCSRSPHNTGDFCSRSAFLPRSPLLYPKKNWEREIESWFQVNNHTVAPMGERSFFYLKDDNPLLENSRSISWSCTGCLRRPWRIAIYPVSTGSTLLSLLKKMPLISLHRTRVHELWGLQENKTVINIPVNKQEMPTKECMTSPPPVFIWI